MRLTKRLGRAILPVVKDASLLLSNDKEKKKFILKNMSCKNMI